jgi:hypothetical protein
LLQLPRWSAEAGLFAVKTIDTQKSEQEGFAEDVGLAVVSLAGC